MRPFLRILLIVCNDGIDFYRRLAQNTMVNIRMIWSTVKANILTKMVIITKVIGLKAKDTEVEYILSKKVEDSKFLYYFCQNVTLINQKCPIDLFIWRIRKYSLDKIFFRAKLLFHGHPWACPGRGQYSVS